MTPSSGSSAPRTAPSSRPPLTDHVVPDRFTAGDVGDLDELETANGQALSPGVRVGDAELVATDVRASNGIIHAIDRVLMPRQMPTRSASHH
jgi:uncharacterized surface protein with fasciclin (FAS1) repeats